MSIQVIELTDGYAENIDDTGFSGQRRFIDATARPSVSGTAITLPEIGESFSAQSTAGALSGWNNSICNNIAIEAWDADPSVGYVYVCSYSPYTWTIDPFRDKYEKIVTITTGGGFDNYSVSPNDTKLYVISAVGTAAFPISTDVTFNTEFATSRVSVTERYRGTMADEIGNLSTIQNKLNDDTWNGLPRGCVLCEGSQSQPIEEIVGGETKQYWNRTTNYVIRYLPNIDSYADSWQRIYINGQYSFVSTSSAGSTFKPFYDYADIGNDSL